MKLFQALMFFIVFANKRTAWCMTNNNSEVMEYRPCPFWLIGNYTAGTCDCGTAQLQGIIHCNADPYELSLYSCYCMTYNYDNVTTVAPCLYTCARGGAYFFDIAVNTTAEINEFMCSRYRREGPLCGRCMHGTSPPVYSYYTFCINCTTSNWGKYLAISTLPATAFFVL